MNDLMLRLARLIAPSGADVHDPDTTSCPSERAVLEATEAYDLYPEPDGRVRLDVSAVAKDAQELGWIELTSDYDHNPVFQLTEAGVAELYRLRRVAT